MLTSGAAITSSASRADAGPVTVQADRLEMTGSEITTTAERGEGGQIALQGRLLGLFPGSRITTSAQGQGSTGNAGDITIDPQILVLDRDSRIEAKARAGNGGHIRITADSILRWPPPDSVIDASSETGISGRIDQSTPDRNIAGTLTTLPGVFLDATALLPTACAARLGANVSSLRAGVTGLPADPSGLLVGSYTADRPTDLTTLPAAHPGSRPEAVAARPTGSARLSFACGG
jgi:large exoprotein involved in heme utilization and adhesion